MIRGETTAGELAARCTARRSNGTPCRAPAIRGGTVCQAHGGSAPQVQAKARIRIMMAADVVAARLITIATSKRTKHADAIAAARDLLNRAGIAPEREQTPQRSEGTVLWEEFVQIYRVRT